jgi:hypothetical protein
LLGLAEGNVGAATRNMAAKGSNESAMIRESSWSPMAEN